MLPQTYVSALSAIGLVVRVRQIIVGVVPLVRATHRQPVREVVVVEIHAVIVGREVPEIFLTLNERLARLTAEIDADDEAQCETTLISFSASVNRVLYALTAIVTGTSPQMTLRILRNWKTSRVSPLEVAMAWHHMDETRRPLRSWNILKQL